MQTPSATSSPLATPLSPSQSILFPTPTADELPPPVISPEKADDHTASGAQGSQRKPAEELIAAESAAAIQDLERERKRWEEAKLGPLPDVDTTLQGVKSEAGEILTPELPPPFLSA